MNKKILYLNVPGHRNLPDISSLIFASYGFSTISVTDLKIAHDIILKDNDVKIFVTNHIDLKIIQHHKNIHIILITDLSVVDYIQHIGDLSCVRHIIAIKELEQTIHELRITIKKIQLNDLFGIEKYLAPHTKIQKIELTGSASRKKTTAAISAYAQNINISRPIIRNILSTAEELVMNAIYDAPYLSKERTGMPVHDVNFNDIQLEAKEYGELTYGFDGKILALGVSDPFGLFNPKDFYFYLSKVQLRDNSSLLIDSKQRGAGLGLFRVFYQADSLICNCDPGIKTEVISLHHANSRIFDFSKTSKSIHYFKKLELTPNSCQKDQGIVF